MPPWFGDRCALCSIQVLANNWIAFSEEAPFPPCTRCPGASRASISPKLNGNSAPSRKLIVDIHESWNHSPVRKHLRNRLGSKAQ